MNINEKRTNADSVEAVQAGNRDWWTNFPMAYDWEASNKAERFTADWFAELDQRELHGHRLFATRDEPYDRLMPLSRIGGQRVLEIGCGMGLHSQVLASHGAQLSAVDLTPTAIEATTKRFAIKGLTGEILRADAESLPFEDSTFDFVWSWGVIHHSSRTARVVREIARVLKPDGEVRVMVYNREGASAYLALLRNHLLSGKFLSRSFEESLFAGTDGYSARYYVQEQFEDLFRGFFENVSSEVCGQDVDALPLPRLLRNLVLPLIPLRLLEKWQARRGGFIFLTASGRR